MLYQPVGWKSATVGIGPLARSTGTSTCGVVIQCRKSSARARWPRVLVVTGIDQASAFQAPQMPTRLFGVASGVVADVTSGILKTPQWNLTLSVGSVLTPV